jgi:N-dimethylarginine dimethylaminohydrolase
VQTIKHPNEINTKPKAVLVHNPALSGVLDTVDKENHLDLLFSLPPKPRLASAEHTKLTALLNEQGVKTIEVFEILNDADKAKLKGNPNLIFTRDPLITLPWKPGLGIVGRMKKAVRQYEPTAFEHIAETVGLEKILRPPEDVCLEGGDVIPVTVNGKRIIVIRTGGRSSPAAVPFLLKPELDICDAVLEIYCDNKTLHLDSVMGFCGQDIVVCDRNSVKKGTLHTATSSQPIGIEECLTLSGFRVLPVSFAEADRLQATNFINLGSDTIIAYSGCQRIIEELVRDGINVLSFDGHELAKGRGGPRCLTRPIY